MQPLRLSEEWEEHGYSEVSKKESSRSGGQVGEEGPHHAGLCRCCLLYTSDAADDWLVV